jgi:photosystem II stability/assembly factor-like uncharacterized protein
MKYLNPNYYLCQLISLLVISINIHAQWNLQYSQSGELLNCVYFVDYNNGWAVGGRFGVGALILKSTDGGTTWNDNLTIPATVNLFESVYFTDANNGWVVGGGGVMMMTTNAGNTWDTVTVPTNGYLRQIQFIDENYGWAVGTEDNLTRGIILRTIDSGINWERIDIGEGNILWSIYFVNESLGWGVGSDIQKTTDGGLSWVTINDSTGGGSIYFADELNGWSGGISSGGPYGFIHKTTDGGYNWSSISGLDIPSLTDVNFLDKNIGWAVGFGSSGPIIKTTDGGNNWFHQESGTIGSLYSVCIIDSVTGWTAGPNNILKTTNGGVTFVKEHNDEIPTNYSLSQNYPNPFNPSTTIRFAVPSPSFTTLKIYNSLGEEVAVLINKELTTGSYEIEWNAGGLPSGVYFYRIQAGYFVETKKMVLMR